MNTTIRCVIKHHLKWSLISAVVGVVSGIASAIFLLALDKATNIREQNNWLLFLLPIGGLLVGTLYHIFGKKVEGGNNLVLDEFHAPQATIPFRMAPLVLLGTIGTHLFGGSAGREGTAVQMGASIADQVTHFFKVNKDERRMLLMIGMSSGFGSVFGVPIAGTIFGLEVLAIGKLHLRAIFQCAISAFIAHYVTISLGAHHIQYFQPSIDFPIDIIVISLLVVSGVFFGFAARLFAFLTDILSKYSKKYISHLPTRMFFGGVIISLLFFLVPSLIRYAGLGVPVIVESIQNPILPYDWFLKLLLTALTLGLGFKGGEVTPLLFIGVTLGNALSSFIPIPLPILAVVGFVGVFAGAANTPIACTLMAMELFGVHIGIFAAIVSFSSYFASGHRGIYLSQRVHLKKSHYSRLTIRFLLDIFRNLSLKKNNQDKD